MNISNGRLGIQYFVKGIHIMNSYVFMPKNDIKDMKYSATELFHRLQEDVYDSFSFRYDFVYGSSKMNIVGNDNKGKYLPEIDAEIVIDNVDFLRIFIDSLNKRCEFIHHGDATFIIDMYNSESNNIDFKINLSIIRNPSENPIQFVSYNENSRRYEWKKQNSCFCDIKNKIKWIRKKNLTEKLKANYKNKLDNENLISSVLFAEAVTEICNNNGYNKPATKTKNRHTDTQKNEIYKFVYVTKAKAKPAKILVVNIIQELQKLLKGKLTFQYKFVGSSSRNMITEDIKGNVGFDFDVDIIPNLPDNYKPKQIRDMIRNALNNISCKNGFSCPSDSTSVLEIKCINREKSKIVYSCDFAIVRVRSNNRKQFIRYNKSQNNYAWEYRGDEYDNVSEKYNWIKNNEYVNKLRDCYIDMKNKNYCKDRHSRTIFAEAVNNIYNKYRKR